MQVLHINYIEKNYDKCVLRGKDRKNRKMNNILKKTSALLLSAALCMAAAACGETNTESANEISFGNAERAYAGAHVIKLQETEATIDGSAVEVFDYTWHADPSEAHDEVKNAPAEYYTGSKRDTTASAYIDHDLKYYPMLDESGFRLANYDGEPEYVYYYNDGENDQYIFATLPRLGKGIPTSMMHTPEEASQNSVLHITKAGSYILEGVWKGQIWVDLGEQDSTFADENAKVTLILNGTDINCTVAPGIVFYSVYEADNQWEERSEHDPCAAISRTGANIIIADESTNTVSGTNVFRMLKTKYKDEDSTDSIKVQKKQRKTDGALYSYVSMSINGGENSTGTLTVNSGFEGIDSELHLSLNSGNITVNAQDDGINVNEDHVSTVIFNDANVTLNAGLGAEGDGVDSNGFAVLGGGILKVNNVTAPDSAVDSEDGIYCTNTKVYIDGKDATPETGSIVDSISGSNQGMGPGGQGGPGGFDPGQQPPEPPEGFDNQNLPERPGADGQQPPEKPNGEMPGGGQPPEMPNGGIPEGGQPPADLPVN